MPVIRLPPIVGTTAGGTCRRTGKVRLGNSGDRAGRRSRPAAGRGYREDCGNALGGQVGIDRRRANPPVTGCSWPMYDVVIRGGLATIHLRRRTRLFLPLQRRQLPHGVDASGERDRESARLRPSGSVPPPAGRENTFEANSSRRAGLRLRQGSGGRSQARDGRGRAPPTHCPAQLLSVVVTDGCGCRTGSVSGHPRSATA